MKQEQIERMLRNEFVQSAYSGGWPTPNGEHTHGEPLFVVAKADLNQLLLERDALLKALRKHLDSEDGGCECLADDRCGVLSEALALSES